MANNTVQPKFAIIGKVWLNKTSKTILPASITMPEDITFDKNESYVLAGMSFKTDRNLPEKITVKAGEKLFLFNNPKRPGIRDADYSVSILLPEEDAKRIIEGSAQGRLAWKAANLAPATA